MYKITQVKQVIRPAKKFGKVVVNALNFIDVHVEDDSTGIVYELNLHSDGKQEFLIDYRLAATAGQAYNYCLAAANEFKSKM